MAFCSQCGTQISNAADRCPNCGTTTLAAPNPSPNPEETIAENKPETVKQINSAIQLSEGETILWHRETTQGLIHKEVVLEEAVTNRRCLKYDVKNNQVTAQLAISRRPEVVVMNIHRVNDSLGGGVFLTPRMFGVRGLGGFGVYGGPRRGYLKVFGDVSFLNDGKVVMTFESVKDPQGVRQLVEALKREQGSGGQWNVRPWFGARMRPRQFMADE